MVCLESRSKRCSYGERVGSGLSRGHARGWLRPECGGLGGVEGHTGFMGVAGNSPEGCWSGARLNGGRQRARRILRTRTRIPGFHEYLTWG